MKNFKGTKGKWEAKYMNDSITVSTKEAYICDVDIHEEGEANALLISKAPELLDMVEKLTSVLHIYAQVEADDDLIKEAFNLINQATQL